MRKVFVSSAILFCLCVVMVVNVSAGGPAPRLEYAHYQYPKNMVFEADLTIDRLLSNTAMVHNAYLFWTYIATDADSGIEIIDIYSDEIQMGKYLYPEYGIYIFYGYIPKDKEVISMKIKIQCKEVGTWNLYIPGLYFYDSQWNWLYTSWSLEGEFQVIPAKGRLLGMDVISSVKDFPISVEYKIKPGLINPGSKLKVYFNNGEIEFEAAEAEVLQKDGETWVKALWDAWYLYDNFSFRTEIYKRVYISIEIME